ncbi:MAG: hypothetical protein NTV34_18235 [Proteobacteria bacterium]|nr:hypothetical protein [Pseudomonadota bacterium]
MLIPGLGHIIGIVGLMSIVGCGIRKGDREPEVARGPIESAFYAASAVSGVPVRMILASAYLESGVNPQPQSVTYQKGGGLKLSSAIHFGDSAFGLTQRELGLADDPGAASSLEVQVAAYGRLLKERFNAEGLPYNAVTPEEKIRWMWRLAQVHRGGDRQNRNLWAIYAKEMMGVLNEGFEVRNVSSDESLILEKESVPLREDQLPVNYQQDLTLTTYSSDIRNIARLFSLRSPKYVDLRNKPVRIEVVHCPLSLSACLNLQTSDNQGYVGLGAHYIVPNMRDGSPGILQVARHDEPVGLIGLDGSLEIVTDRIIVMLAGNSGRYVDGVRTYANPMWVNDTQLRLLGDTINAICVSLELGAENIPRDRCLNSNISGGLTFRTQSDGMYRWGDISEYDKSIIDPYINSDDGILATTAMSATDGRSVIEAATHFSVNIQFQPSARRVEVERLVRCDGLDRRVVWEPVDVKPVRNVSSKSVEMLWDDAGPNGNGDQFFRAKVTGESGKFLGWAMTKVQLRNFNKDPQSEGVSTYCFRR